MLQMLWLAAVPAGDDTPILTYCLVGGTALLLIAGVIVMQILSKRKK